MSKRPELVASGAEALLSEFQSSCMATQTRFPPLLPKPCVDWIAPPPGKFKLNSAVACRVNSKSTGVRTAIRDDRGRVLIARANQLAGHFSSVVRELFAIMEGLRLAKLYNLNVNLVEFASPRAASLLSNPVLSLGFSKLIVADIKALMFDAGICKILAIPKSGNSLALKLAHHAFSSVEEFLWLDSSSVFR